MSTPSKYVLLGADAINIASKDFNKVYGLVAGASSGAQILIDSELHQYLTHKASMHAAAYHALNATFRIGRINGTNGIADCVIRLQSAGIRDITLISSDPLELLRIPSSPGTAVTIRFLENGTQLRLDDFKAKMAQAFPLYPHYPPYPLSTTASPPCQATTNPIGRFHTEDGRAFVPGDRIAGGAEGSVYRSGAHVLKFYNPACCTPEKYRILSTLYKALRSSPTLRAHCAIPVPLFTESNEFTGCVAPYIEGELLELLCASPAAWMRGHPEIDGRKAIFSISRQIAMVARELHARKLFITDLKGNNLILTSGDKVIFVDADSFTPAGLPATTMLAPTLRLVKRPYQPGVYTPDLESERAGLFALLFQLNFNVAPQQAKDPQGRFYPPPGKSSEMYAELPDRLRALFEETLAGERPCYPSALELQREFDLALAPEAQTAPAQVLQDSASIPQQPTPPEAPPDDAESSPSDTSEPPKEEVFERKKRVRTIWLSIAATVAIAVLFAVSKYH
jgi:hypothetical protein